MVSRTFQIIFAVKAKSGQVSRWHDQRLGLGYFILASPAVLLTRFEGGIALLWVATALLVPRLARLRPEHWPRPIIYCGLASMAATTMFGAGLAAAPLLAAAMLFEAAVGALLLRRFMPDGRFFDTVPRVGVFVGLIGFLMPAVSAFGGAGAASLTLGQAYWDVWPDWAVTHGLGTLICMPLVTLASRPDTRIRLTEIRANWGGIDWCLVALAVIVNVVVFAQTKLPILFLPTLPLILLTVRHRQIGASGAVLLIAIIGGGLTTIGLGPVALIRGSHHQEILFFQFFLATCIVTALPMAAEMNRRHQLTRRLQESEALYRLMADRSGDILLNLSRDGIIQYVSPSISQIGGFSPTQLCGTASIDLVIEQDRAIVTRAHLNAIDRPNETFVYEYRASTLDGRIVWFETHSRAILDENARVVGVVNSVRDVSHRKTLESRLMDEASKDPLTGLANRRVFDKLLAAALAQRSEGQWAGCLAIADIDHFKNVNDHFGHTVGDVVLREVATVIRSCLRSSDAACRIGGEEFGFILWGLSIGDCRKLCERVRESLAGKQIMTASGAIQVTISIGIADLANYDSVSGVTKAADDALYEAKRAGRNRLAIAGGSFSPEAGHAVNSPFRKNADYA